MTFYWWSHWFWITCMLFLISVQTYPTQNQKKNILYNIQEQQQQQQEEDYKSADLLMTTKLYQTTSSIIWPTAIPKKIETTTTKTTKTILINDKDNNNSNSDSNISERDNDNDNDKDRDSNNAIIQNKRNSKELNLNTASLHSYHTHNANQYEFKRSADYINNNDKQQQQQQQQQKDKKNNDELLSAGVADENLNNYTNFSQSTNATKLSTKNNHTSTISTTTTKTTTTATTTPVKTGKSSKNNTSISALIPLMAQNMSMPPDAANLHMVSTSSVGTVTTLAMISATPAMPHIDTVLDTDTDADTVTTEHHVAPFTLENANKEDELRRAELEHRTRKSKVLSADYKHINRHINYSSDTKSLLTRSASIAPHEYIENEESNISSEALAIQRTYFLDAGAISAICFTVFGICCTVGTIGIVLYRRRYLNKPQTLSEPDSSVYIDDSTMRDNSDEMYSLDNDSFLNSLEAMTIQNYWTDTVKHTKL